MEFRFNLNDIFKDSVVEIGSTLVPPGFNGDKRSLWDTQSKVTQIVNAMGEASAHAQGLSKPITTADKLRNSEHRLYLLIDQNANQGKGAVTGMLKTGEKSLYVFDRDGQHYQVSPPCVLDFYIHESRQRSGFGKQLFEHMLHKEQTEPVRMAIDRPSEKFLGFLNKHYGLNAPVKQMNNFVVFDGFFPKTSEPARTVETDNSNPPTRKQSANGLQQGNPSRPFGRYGAPRPPCSMGQIIHNESAVIKGSQKPTGTRSNPTTNFHPGQTYHPHSDQLAWQVTQSAPNMFSYPTQNRYQYFSMAQGDAPMLPQTGQYSITPPVIPTQQPIRSRDPLIPQSFDGTPRMTPHYVQSQPLQVQYNRPIQSSASAPMQFHLHQNILNTEDTQQNPRVVPPSGLPNILEESHTLGAVPPSSNQAPYVNQISNRTISSINVHNGAQLLTQQMTPKNPNVSQNNQQVQDLPITYQPDNPSPVTYNSVVVPQNVTSATTFNTPINQDTQHQNVQQMLVSSQDCKTAQEVQSYHQQYLERPSLDNTALRHQNVSSATAFNTPINQDSQHQNVQQGLVPSQDCKTAQEVQSYHQQYVGEPCVDRTPVGRQDLQPQNVQQIAGPPRNLETLQNIPHQQNPVVPFSGTYNTTVTPQNVQQIIVPPQDFKSPEQVQSLSIPHQLGQELSSCPQPTTSLKQELQIVEEEGRYRDQLQEVDLSKGYPPQHHQTPVAARPPIVIRN